MQKVLEESGNLGYYLVRDACEEFLREITEIKNCLNCLEVAHRYSLHKLNDRALSIGARNFKTLSKKVAFKELPIEQAISLFKVSAYIFLQICHHANYERTAS